MENSQLDAKISGMEIKSGQKRDSILAQTSELKNEVKDKSINAQVTSAKVRCLQEGVIESNPFCSAAEHLECCCKFSVKINALCNAGIIFFQMYTV